MWIEFNTRNNKFIFFDASPMIANFIKSDGPLLWSNTAFFTVVLNSKYISPLWPMSNVGSSMDASDMRNVTALSKSSTEQKIK